MKNEALVKRFGSLEREPLLYFPPAPTSKKKWEAPTQDENLALLEADFRKWEKSQDVPHRGRLQGLQGQLTKEPSCRLKF